MIEREHGAPVATLFEVYGQGTFRRYERECLARIVAAHEAAVIATAGGIVADDETFAQLLDRTHVIWLQASPAEHMRRVMAQGDFRPMADNRDAMNDLIAILDARAPVLRPFACTHRHVGQERGRVRRGADGGGERLFEP